MSCALKLSEYQKLNRKFDCAFWYYHVLKIKNQKIYINGMVDKDDYLLKKQIFLRLFRSNLIRLFKKLHLTEICQGKLNEILRLFHIFLKLLYNLK